MDNKDLIKVVKKCINEQCDEQCLLYNNCDNCQFKLLDEIMSGFGVIPEDYIDWLMEKYDVSND